ncbi:MAG: helix-turn-helix domain-containing protein, partial [Muribaculaceae bacterium]|nr:helix-turn-helix domain-containing protein [Muribaculaceae bacterium]
MGINYDDINLPRKVSDILQLDFFLMENVPAIMVKTVRNPVKFSAFTSIFVTRGKCEADINLIHREIQAPAIINVSSDWIVQPNEVSDDFEASFMVLSKRLTNTISSTILNLSILSLHNGNPVIQIRPEDLDAFNRFYGDVRTLSEAKSHKFQYEALLFSTIAFFYSTVAKYFVRSDINSNDSRHNRIADQFLILLQDHYRKERFLDFYAEKLGITPKHLSRTVKSQTGLSPVEWIGRYIILEAKVMLRSSNLNIQQISDELNFPSQSFFGKYFKKATGLS